uniref:PIH1 domain containing 1 n=1 Tax=Eptatretus burgeri TaxID=7764 RepID=A0A8C4QE76_EPTBU
MEVCSLLSAVLVVYISNPNSPLCASVTPGFCIKTIGANPKEMKVFVNVCSSSTVPMPPGLIDEEELIKALQSGTEMGLRLPMSLGEGHSETDHAGQLCMAYDVVINPDLHERVKTSELFRSFLMTVILEGLEDKNGIKLDKEWTVLKNRKFMGTLLKQNIRIGDKAPQKIEEVKERGVVRQVPHIPSGTLLGQPCLAFATFDFCQTETSVLASTQIAELLWS